MRHEAGCLPIAIGSELPPRLEGTHFYRKMRTASQPALLRASDEKLYVVKWSDANRPHILANEVIGHALLEAVGLPVAPWKPFYASEAFIDANPDMWPQTSSGQRRIRPGMHFASEFLGTENTGTVFEWLPTRWRSLLTNAHDLLGAYIFDVWTGACHPRKVVFCREGEAGQVRAILVNNSELFGGRGWRFSRSQAWIFNHTFSMYAAEWNEEAVTAWISTIRIRAPVALRELSRLVPPSWQEGDVNVLAEALSKRLESLNCLTANEFQRSRRGHSCTNLAVNLPACRLREPGNRD